MGTELRGLVVRVQSRAFTVRVDGEDRPAVLPKRLRYNEPGVVDPVAVGDRVTLSWDGEQGVIEGIEPRKNAVSRPASGRPGKTQILAANLDVAMVVMAAEDPRWKTTTIDRYLVLASAGKVPASVCVNKLDLDPEVRSRPELKIYHDLGIRILFVSALTGEGLDTLRASLAGKTGVLIGPSGVGKTSLVNRLVPAAQLPVGEVSERTHKGRHITSWVELRDLPDGGRLVDSPGLRVLDLTGVDPQELGRHFPEIASRIGRCRFPDCRHLAEPGCAIKEAVEAGAMARRRYRSYERIHASLSAGQG